MKPSTLILTLALCVVQSRADLVIEARATDVPYQVKILIINNGDESVTFDYPSPDRYPEFHSWSPFHWRIQSDEPLPMKAGPVAPPQGEWFTASAISSRAYLPDEWDALFESRILAPSGRISYTGDIRRIMPFFDWDKAAGEVAVEFMYPGKSLEESERLFSKPLEIKL